ncbi:MAG: hypothetical protein U0637_11680 [Phycisphaerales bacterium]
MKTRLVAAMISAAGLCVTCVGAARADLAPQDGADRLRADFPGVQVIESPGGVRTFYGRTLNDGASPSQAATDFVNAYRSAFGPGGIELGVREHNTANYGALHTFVYAQVMDGLPVENAFVSVAVRTLRAAQGLPDPLVHAVVLAQGQTAPAPAGGFAPDAVDAKQAQEAVRAVKGYDSLTTWHDDAQMVVYFDPTRPGVPAVRAWRFSAATITAADPRAFTFFVDAATGSIVHVRDDIHHADITGSVVGLVTPPNRPDIAANPPVQQPIGEVKVEVVGTSPLVFAFTGRDGAFTIPWTGSDPVTLRVSAGGGRWNAVTNNTTAAFNVSQPATPGTPVTIDLLNAPTATTQSQINGLVYANQTHDFVRDRAAIATLDTAIATNVNEASTCNAFYQAGPPDSIHFFASGGGCVNTSYASVVNHEYGHFVVNERNLGQGAFGEGFADVLSILINDDPIIGREFGTSALFPPDGAIRHLDGSGEALPSYPCTGEVHLCGEVLGRVVWNIRNNMGTRYGSALGLDLTRDLIGDWIVIMSGGETPSTGDNAAHAGTAAEMLTADDTDGNTSNGTPNYPQIRAAFLERGINVPCVDARVILQPQAVVPSVITTGAQPITVPVTITAGTAQVVGTPSVKWRLGTSGAFQTIPMTPAGPPGSYTAHFPTLTCGQSIQYYYATETSEAYNGSVTELTFPSHTCGSADAVLATQATDTSTSFTESFEVDNPLWSRTLAGGGSWIRSDFATGNISTGSNPTSDTTPPPGVAAWITGKDFQTNPNAGDLDGVSVLTSPVFNLSGAAGAIVSYQRWFSLTTPTSGDEFRVEVTVNNGLNWTVAERLLASEGNSWKTGSFSLGALGLTPSATTRIRFVGTDLPGTVDTTFEAAIDDLSISTLQCNTGPTCDPIDFNGDTLFPDTADIADFLSVFGGGACPTGTCGDIDFNNDGLFPDTDDIAALLRVFSGGAC